MIEIVITLLTILAAMVLFAWNPIPAAVVAVCASLVLYLSGVLTMQEMISGFGDPVVVLIAALLAIATGLEVAGVGAWAGQVLMRYTGANPTRRVIAIMIVAAVFSGLIGMNGAVAAMLPVVVVVAVRTGVVPSRLMIPLAFACLTGAKLTLLGTPVNVIAATLADEASVGHIGFFEWSVLGIPQLAGTIIIVIVFGKWLLPERHSQAIPADFSGHGDTLVEQYLLDQGLHYLRVQEASPFIGQETDKIDLAHYPDLHMVAMLERDGSTPLQREHVLRDDLMLVRGEAAKVAAFAETMNLETQEREEPPPVANVLVSRNSGLAEVVIPMRSKMIGVSVFPGMIAEDGALMVLAIRRGSDAMRQKTVLRAGDHLLLRGTWEALDRYLAAQHLLVVDSPETVKKQAVPLGQGAYSALGILLLLVVLLAFDIVPPPIAAVICATLMIITRVITLAQFYRGIDWNTCILIGAMIPPAIAMTKTGAAALIGDYVVNALGSAGPHAVLAGLFIASATISQFISNTSASLVMMPIGLATASEMGVSALPMMLGVAMGSSASFLTPFANGVSLMVYGPGGYKFGDFWRLGLIVMAWTMMVTVAIIPIYWKF